MTEAVYVFGPPGVGKSSLLARWGQTVTGTCYQAETPVPHVVLGDSGWVELGRARGEFSGTDALGMAVITKALRWLRETPPPRLLGEGDRLACEPWFDALIFHYQRPRLVYLRGAEEAAQRAAARAARLGTAPQNEAWRKGRVTKCERLAARYPAWVEILDASAPADVLDRRFAEIISG